jgi:superfamily II DNA helicase RecQ
MSSFSTPLNKDKAMDIKTILIRPTKDFTNIYYLQRISGNKGNTNRQMEVIGNLIEKFELPSMDESNTIREDCSGRISPNKRFLPSIIDNSLVVAANLDRLFKSKDLDSIKLFYESLLSRNIKILVPKMELLRFKNLLRSLNKDNPKLEQKFIRQVSLRMSESLNCDSSVRKGVKPYCKRSLDLLNSALSSTSDPELQLWVLISFTGATINEYLRDKFCADPSTRLPRFDFKTVQTLLSIESHHPDFTRKQISAYARNYDVDLTPHKISMLRGTKSFALLNDFAAGNFEPEIEKIFNCLELSDFPVSWEGLSKFEITLLKSNFPHLEGLRDWQLKTIESLKNGNHTVLQVMAGGGKSLTFQLPALLGDSGGVGVVVVVSPFVRLIQNQVQSNVKLIGNVNFNTRCLNSGVLPKDRQQTLKLIQGDQLSLLFLTPEQLDPRKSNFAVATIEALVGKVKLLVLDEAHHPRIDGYQFRSSYLPKKLNQTWKSLDKPQCLFLSASLSKKSHESLRTVVGNKKLRVIKGPLHPQNVALFRRIFDGPEAQAMKITWCVLMVNYLRRELNLKKVIVYVNRPARVVQMMDQFKAGGNKKVYGIHARKVGKNLLTPDEISGNQAEFESPSKSGVMVATSAYSEGIDVNVDAVIVMDLPVNIETLYQELLRCGHQGQKGLAFICVDKAANRFNQYSLLRGDLRKVKEYDKNFEFLAEDSLDLWEEITKTFIN